MDKIIAQKYGGSSVANTEKIKSVAKKIAKKVKSGYKVIVVVSAMGKTTDNLIKLAKEITDYPDPREMDMLLTTGEQVSVSLLSIALSSMKLRSKSLNGYQAGIITTGSFSEARIKNFDRKKILDLIKNLDVIVLTGFQGVNENGDLTTLGRGGSDTSAVALAASLGIDCEIYSDVAGIYTVDPKLHPNAKKIKYITHDEMLEMASLGAKVLHSRSVEIAKRFGIKIYCGSTFSNEEGSYVVDESEIIEKPVVTGLSVFEEETQVTIKNLPTDFSLVKKVFEKLAAADLNVDMISIINHDESLTLSFTIIEDMQKKLDKTLNKVLKALEGWQIEYNPDFVKLSVVGIGMKSSVGVASRFFKALENLPIKLVTTSEIRISCLVDKNLKQEAVNAIVKEFDL
jgi:aspartate kinase